MQYIEIMQFAKKNEYYSNFSRLFITVLDNDCVYLVSIVDKSSHSSNEGWKNKIVPKTNSIIDIAYK